MHKHRQIPRFAHLLTALALIPPAIGLQNRPAGFDDSSEVKFAKTTARGEYLLRMLQFETPYPGHFQELMLYRDGLAVTQRTVPNWAIQNSQFATLTTNALAEVQRRLTTLDLSGYSDSAEPQPSGLHSVLIYFDGRSYQRRNINGLLPASVQTPIDLIRAAIHAEANSRDAIQKTMQAYDALKNEEQILRDGFRWTVPKEIQHRSLEDRRGLLLTVSGLRGDAATSIYHALIFYPDGNLSSKPGDPGNWQGNPRAWLSMTFEHPNDGIGIKTVRHQLVIEYRLVGNTVHVGDSRYAADAGDSSYPLVDGNLFVIRMDKNWTPVVQAVRAHVDGPFDASTILERFKALLPTDSEIQSLRLGR
jgi:hypothetical protein